MEKKRWKKIESVIDKALDLKKSEQETELFIRESCKNDNQLYQQVIELFKSINRANEVKFLEQNSSSTDY